MRTAARHFGAERTAAAKPLMSMLWWIATVLLMGCCGGMAWVFQPATVAWRARQRPPHECEDTFVEVTTSTQSKSSSSAAPEHLEPFPSVHDPASVTVSVIVPAYNEEGRLPSMMDPTLDFFGSKMKTERWVPGCASSQCLARVRVPAAHSPLALPYRAARQLGC